MTKFSLTAKRKPPYSGPQDDGPCYDLCMCRHCWRGWSDLSFRSKLKYRIAYIWRDSVRRKSW
jgi:hypothetical protein